MNIPNDMNTPNGFFDRCVAALLLVLVLPVFALLMLINRLWTGRWFFQQVRIGRGLRPFVFLKFQTMSGSPNRSTVTVALDPRITPYGRALRGLKLDELPQLLNVLRGDMNLVGPRPLTPNEVAKIPGHLAKVVYRVRPGMTGASAVAFVDEERLLSSIEHPEQFYYDVILPRKVALELAYVQHKNWWRDLCLLLLTPVAPFWRSLRRWAIVRLIPDWQPLEVNGGLPSRRALSHSE